MVASARGVETRSRAAPAPGLSAGGGPRPDRAPYGKSPHPAPDGSRLLLAGEPRAPLQPLVRTAAAVVLSGARSGAGARAALGAKRGRRDPAEPLRRGGGRLGTDAVHAMSHRCRALARGSRHPRPRRAPARADLRRHSPRVTPPRAIVPPPGY